MPANKYLKNVSGNFVEEFAANTSTGASDGGRIVALDDTGKLANSMMPSGIGADTAVIQASEALAAGDLVNVWSSAGAFRARKADASTGGKESSRLHPRRRRFGSERHRLLLRGHGHPAVRARPGCRVPVRVVSGAADGYRPDWFGAGGAAGRVRGVVVGAELQLRPADHAGLTVAVRPPLVLVGTQIAQMPVGDTIPADDLPTGDAVGVARYVELAAQADTISATLANLTGMAFAVSAGGTYVLDGLLRFNGPTTADVKFAFTGPAMTTCLWTAGGLDASATAMATTGSFQAAGFTGIGSLNTAPVACSGGLITVCRPSGVFRPSAAGTLQLQWAQNSANVLASSVYPPSFLTLRRVA